MLRRFNKCWKIVSTVNEVKGYSIRSKGRLWSSLTGKERYKDGSKTSVGEFVRDFSKSQRDVDMRRLRRGLNRNFEVSIGRSEKDRTRRFKKIGDG